ncbi:hypothetical protein BK004_02875 [bacterium CG10_46_32]|nr:MAG: hypothetical protein BK004_02875 [bacterium CG10_46_32]PIR56044.1 MAG: hypothetical protein COU73_02905 [Parcubacteria group bacterium CG10_big_fil_rev_8_21_14_0_10_46_32]
MLNILQIQGFDWDRGNLDKNWRAHGVASGECEEMFFNRPLLIEPDRTHSQSEARYYALGKTNDNRLLFASFTIRNNRIRVISARDMSRKERIHYGKA